MTKNIFSETVYIRPLELDDALVSCHWRNNPKIWRYTGSKPNQFITPEIETEWLKEVLQRPNEKRFAICTHPDNKYIGNVFFTNIDDESAELHIFIGDVNYWGGNRAADTIRLFMEYAFDKMKLKRVDSIINPENKNAVTMADYFGFVVVEKIVDEVSGIVYSKYCLTRETFITVNPNSRQTTTTSHNYE